MLADLELLLSDNEEEESIFLAKSLDVDTHFSAFQINEQEHDA